MLRENWRFISRIERFADALIITISFFAAYYLRPKLVAINYILGLDIPFEGKSLAPVSEYSLVLIVGVISYLVALSIFGAYRSMRLSSFGELLRMVVCSGLTVFFVLTSILYSVKMEVSRSFLILFCGLALFGLLIDRVLVLRVLRYWRRRGRNFRNLLICGVGQQAEKIAFEVWKRPELGIGIKSFVILNKNETNTARGLALQAQLSDKEEILVGVEELANALHRLAIDEVIFTDVARCLEEVEEAVVICSEVGVRTTIAADLFSIGLAHSAVSYFSDVPLIHYQRGSQDKWGLSLKRVIDVIISCVLLLLLAPVFLIIATLILVVDGKPVLFKQKRVGLNGRLFSLYKFRSMRVGAENEQERLAEHNEMLGPVFKMSGDPRITKVGMGLRRFSLDELPQLWNVLRGDMSLVGPRPPMPGEVKLYERAERRRLSMRPGLTCTWQVSGRNNIKDFESWVRLDLDYIDNWSLGRDLALLLRTIPAVLFGAGAR